MNQLLIAFGVFFAYLFQYILLKFSGYTDHWKLVFGFTTATILIQSFFLITKYNFETPKYLLEHQKEEECRKVLEYIYNEEHVSEVLNMLKADL